MDEKFQRFRDKLKQFQETIALAAKLNSEVILPKTTPNNVQKTR